MPQTAPRGKQTLPRVFFFYSLTFRIAAIIFSLIISCSFPISKRWERSWKGKSSPDTPWWSLRRKNWYQILNKRWRITTRSKIQGNFQTHQICQRGFMTFPSPRWRVSAVIHIRASQDGNGGAVTKNAELKAFIYHLNSIKFNNKK